ncbi:MAG: hypothetical protein MI924_21510 [Chloroflexales bacterium]|nr:hypothetical protein [Chloroflexales bacterium]
MKSVLSEPKVIEYCYPRTTRILISCAGVTLIFIGAAFLGMAGYWLQQIGDLLIIALFLFGIGLLGIVSGGIIIAGVLSPKLQFSPHGIYYRDLSYSIEAGWDAVRSIGMGRMGRGVAEGLMLDMGAQAQVRYFTPLRIEFRHAPEFIPLDPFERQWRQGSIGQVLQTYTPQLMHR